MYVSYIDSYHVRYVSQPACDMKNAAVELVAIHTNPFERSKLRRAVSRFSSPEIVFCPPLNCPISFTLKFPNDRKHVENRSGWKGLRRRYTNDVIPNLARIYIDEKKGNLKMYRNVVAFLW